MAKIILWIIGAFLWLFFLHVFRKADLKSWHFIIGSLGLFALLMTGVVRYLSDPLAKTVAAMAGLFGRATGWYEPYFRYSMIFIKSGASSLSMRIDFECSGVVEILAFECLLIFFDIYNREEKIITGILGFCAIMVLNALRIVLICTIVHFWGIDAFGVAHTFIGRIFFYVFTVVLYFYVFTRSQVSRMKVDNLTYGRFKRNA